ncbi:MAG TPA: hypothetical protein VMH23_06045 [Bacteroidota bacterium]|nr:hypothetical protein [Bacteroidota bacterium]
MKMTTARLTGLVALLFVLVSPLCAQGRQLAEKAQAAYDKKSFAEGGPLFLLAAQVDAGNASVHLYNAACCFALAGQNDLAFYTLDAAIAKGWKDKAHTEKDEDLVSLRTDPRWNTMLKSLGSGERDQHVDAIVNDMNNLGAQAYQYRIRPSAMGGGQGSYRGFRIADKMRQNANATYELAIANDTIATFRGTSALGRGTVEVSIDPVGRLGDWKYTGSFAKPASSGNASLDANRDALINDMNNLAAVAYQYRIRPASMGGGQGSYSGLRMPEKMKTNENGSFLFMFIGKDEVRIKAISAKLKSAAIETTLDGDGRLKGWTYFGDFQR